MRRLLLPTAAFVRATRRLVKKFPGAVPFLQAALEGLAENAFLPSLRTHKLKGELAGSWACSMTTICGSFSSLSSTKVPKPSFFKRSASTMRFTNAVAADVMLGGLGR